MKLYIISGEPSGDLHGSNLIAELKKQDPDLDVWAWGGDLMEKQGAKIRKHYRNLAFMGFVEVALNLRTILRNMAFCKKDIMSFKPDAIVLIDYPGFNLKIAKWAKKQGIKVIYYIAPQVWAWHKSRVKQIRKYVDKLLVILPFEKEFFKKHKVEAEYVGHPLWDEINQNNDSYSVTEDSKPIIALLPGSRKQEIKTILPIQLQVVDLFPDYTFIIAGSKQYENIYNELIKNKNVEVIYGQTYALLRSAKAALVKSGTATLETALLGTPEIVCYKGSYLSYLIARNLVEVKHIALPNLIMNKTIVPELIQKDLNVNNLSMELAKILGEEGVIQKENYKHLIEKLGGNEANASRKAAESILSFIRNN